ncbi:hypothetical protein SDJN02_27475, partial [Cucurbita argyrosperma subsp. argyrosperma]
MGTSSINPKASECKIHLEFANLFNVSVKLPPHRRFRNSPLAQGLPSQSSSPPVTMPGTKTTGIFFTYATTTLGLSSDLCASSMVRIPIEEFLTGLT